MNERSRLFDTIDQLTSDEVQGDLDRVLRERAKLDAQEVVLRKVLEFLDVIEAGSESSPAAEQAEPVIAETNGSDTAAEQGEAVTPAPAEPTPTAVAAESGAPSGVAA